MTCKEAAALKKTLLRCMINSYALILRQVKNQVGETMFCDGLDHQH